MARFSAVYLLSWSLWLLLVPAPAHAEAAGRALAPAAAELLRLDTPPGKPGGRLVVALTAEPRGWNPLVATDNPSLTLLYLLHADLFHIHRGDHTVAPALARELSLSPDGRKYRVNLRQGLRFSDGEPFDADDVIFTFKVLLDEKVGAVGQAALTFGDRKIDVRKIDAYTVEFELPNPSAPGERLFDSLAILPEHLLGPVYREGRIAEVWGLGSDPTRMAGLGPFRLKSHVPGEKVVLERNPHYYKVDSAGQPLPYLDEIVVVFAADEAARSLRFEAGETHLASQLSADSFQRLEKKAASGAKFRVFDLGPGLTYHTLFFNLNAVDPKTLPEIARKQAWFRRKEFRRAVSLAIDRDAMVRLVYRGRATANTSHVSPGNKLFSNTHKVTPRDLPAARALLVSAGFRFDAEGALLDAEGQRVAFTVATNASNRERVQLATLLQEDLKKLGMDVQVVSLEFRSLVDRVTGSFDYEAGILGLGGGDPDPNSTLNVWKSEGRSHLWQLSGKAIFPFEEKLDSLMSRQMVERDVTRRRALLAEAQTLIEDEEPLIALVTPHVLVAAHTELERFAPSVLDPPTLWNAEVLFWRSPAR